MSDIVERLLTGNPGCDSTYPAIMTEAAKTIESLRDYLAKANMEIDRLTRTNQAKREHRDKLLQEVGELKDALARRGAAADGLQDPVTVHINMLRGTIAKPTLAQIIHLYGAEALREALPAADTKPQTGGETVRGNITIPPEALEAAARAVHDIDRRIVGEDQWPTWEELGPADQRRRLHRARAAALALLEAWPGKIKRGEVCGLQSQYWLELPLTGDA